MELIFDIVLQIPCLTGQGSIIVTPIVLN